MTAVSLDHSTHIEVTPIPGDDTTDDRVALAVVANGVVLADIHLGDPDQALLLLAAVSDAMATLGWMTPEGGAAIARVLGADIDPPFAMWRTH